MCEMSALNQSVEKMSKVAYIECPTGLAGDMCLGALIDAGVPLAYLRDRLRGLGLDAVFELTVERVQHQGQQATKAWVKAEDAAHHRHLPEIRTMIQSATLPKRAERWSLEIFQALAIAEGQVHGVPPESVHFHEVGAIDAIIDIVGTSLGFDWLGVEHIYCSAMPTGGGTVRAAHGMLPVPVPAVLQLFSQRSVPLYHNGINRELVTPTGAAIAVTLAQSFGDPPAMSLDKIGLGAGTATLPIPNILRLWLGTVQVRDSPSTETIVLLETQVDDMTPQEVGYLFDVLFAAGAVDVLTHAVGMKKSRPGLLIQVFCSPDVAPACEALLFQETTTLGIRHQFLQRRVLNRRSHRLKTTYGDVRIKIGYRDDAICNVQPEYEDCRRIAQEHQIPLREVYRLAIQTWMAEKGDGGKGR